MSKTKTLKLSEVVGLVIDNRGKNPKSYAEEGIPVIDNYLIVSDGEVNIGEVKRFIDEETYSNFLRKHIEPGDVLMTLVGNGYGQVATAPSERCAIIQNTIGLRCNENNSNQFLYYLLRNNRELLMNLNRGAAQPSIKVGDILKLEFEFPALEAQEIIADVLGGIDQKIQINRQVNQTLEQIAQTLFKSWFVDFDPVRAKVAVREHFEQRAAEHGEPLPAPAALAEAQNIAAAATIAGLTFDPADIDGTRALLEEKLAGMDAEQRAQLLDTAALFPSSLTESEQGEIPEGWASSTIGDEVEIVGGGTPSTKNEAFWVGGVHHWTTPKDLSGLNDKILLGTERKITDAGLAKISSGLLPIDTVLMSSRAPVGYLALAKVPVAVNQGYIAMKCANRLPPEYVLQWAEYSMADIKNRASGTTFAEISKKNFRPIPVTVPTDGVLIRYRDVASLLYTKIENGLRESERLASIRDALLPKLLSGEIQLNSESVAEAS